MKFFVTLAAIALTATGCATTAKDQQWTPRCATVGCTESIAADKLPENAEVAISLCRGDGIYTHQYQRAGGTWRLVSYDATTSPKCAASSGPAN